MATMTHTPEQRRAWHAKFDGIMSKFRSDVRVARRRISARRSEGSMTREDRNLAAHRAVKAMRGDPDIDALIDDPARARQAHELRVSVAEAIARAVGEVPS